MGGDGTIGGGRSCKARFLVYEDIHGHKAQKEYWKCDDDSVNYPFHITFEFDPAKATVTKGKVVVEIQDKRDKVDISW